MRKSDQKPHIGFIQELCADLSDVEKQEAQENFWSYLEVVKRIALSDIHSSDSTKIDSQAMNQSPEGERSS